MSLKRTVVRCGAVMVAALAVSAVALAAGGGVAGTYATTVKSPAEMKGRWVLTFAKGGTYAVALTARPSARGRYSATATTITLREASRQRVRRIRHVRLEEDGEVPALRRKTEAASCQARAAVLSHRFTQVRVMSIGGMRLLIVGAVGAAAATSLTLAGSSGAVRATGTACSPGMSILESPRTGSKEVQAKAINDRGDVAGFADGDDGTFRAILWKGGKATDAVDLGVLPGYVSSEAYAVNNRRVVFGVLYDRKERMFPFRWQDGRMTVLRAPNGKVQPAEPSQRNAINDRGEIVATMTTGGQRRAVRWAPNGKATFLPGLPGHAWTDAFSINADGVVSGWSRRLPNEDDEENPVLWTSAGRSCRSRRCPANPTGSRRRPTRAA